MLDALWTNPLYGLLGLFLGYTSRTLPFNVAPADAVVAIILTAYFYTREYRRRRTPPVRLLIFGSWLILLGQLAASGSTFGIPDLAEVIKDFLPPLVLIGLMGAFANRPDRVIATVIGASLAVVGNILWADNQGSVRLRGGLGNPNLTAHFAATLIVVGGCVLLALWPRLSTRGRGAILMLTGPASVLLLLRTASFGALILVGGSAAYFLWSRAKRVDPVLRLPARLLGLSAIAAICVQLPPEQLLDRARVGGGLSSERFQRSTSGRVELWSDGWNFVQDHPWGAGARPFLAVDWPTAAGEFHHDLLDMAASGGIIALAGVVAIATGLWRLGAAGGATRILLVGLGTSALTRQTWNFRHAWVMLAAMIALETIAKTMPRAPEV